jgi:hypothetical protein
MTQTDTTLTQPGQHIQVNGLNMYYEEYGSGDYSPRLKAGASRA